MTLLQVLQQQGLGSRKVCLALIADGQARVDGVVSTNPKQTVDPYRVSYCWDDVWHDWQETLLIMLHKPLGYECSARPQFHHSVLDLLPSLYRQRGIAPVGRLDVDTSGLLLLTDDGQIIHQLTHPKRHVPKTYALTLADPLTPAQLEALGREIELNDDPKPVRALSVTQTGEASLTLVIDEGRYHQVRRMVGAVGNRVETLVRTQIGALQLPDDLPVGAWRAVALSDIVS